jgi:diketogulonate reductase-like aldo/keto reductase
LYLIHWPTLIEKDDYESIWSEFERFKREGLTKYFSLRLFLCLGFSLNYFFRSIGVSNFTVEDLTKLLKIAHVKPAVNQVVFPPFITVVI